MKLLVLDIETVGLSTKASIVEVGLVLVDTDAKTTEIVFDKVVREPQFNPGFDSSAWIFSNSDLTVEEVEKAELLETYYGEIQGLLDKYPVTAFNKKFDLKFFNDRGFKCNDIECIMLSTKKYFTIKKKGRVKWPSVMEAYKILFPDEVYDEKHRGGDDALHEAKIILKMVDMKKNKEVITEEFIV